LILAKSLSRGYAAATATATKDGFGTRLSDFSIQGYLFKRVPMLISYHRSGKNSRYVQNMEGFGDLDKFLRRAVIFNWWYVALALAFLLNPRQRPPHAS
jgi:hypothetical protein